MTAATETRTDDLAALEFDPACQIRHGRLGTAGTQCGRPATWISSCLLCKVSIFVCDPCKTSVMTLVLPPGYIYECYGCGVLTRDIRGLVVWTPIGGAQ